MKRTHFYRAIIRQEPRLVAAYRKKNAVRRFSQMARKKIDPDAVHQVDIYHAYKIENKHSAIAKHAIDTRHKKEPPIYGATINGKYTLIKAHKKANAVKHFSQLAKKYYPLTRYI